MPIQKYTFSYICNHLSAKATVQAFFLSHRDKILSNSVMQRFTAYRQHPLGKASYPSFDSIRSRLVRGFTLIELMVTISVLAVLAAVALPNFNDLIQRWRIMQAAELLQSTLYLARSEAMKRGGNVIVERKQSCPGANSASDWNCGWQVCHSTDTKAGCSASSAQLIQVYETPSNIEATRKTKGERLIFDRQGRPSGVRGFGMVFVPKDQSTNHAAARGVCMGSGNRIRIVPGSDYPCDDI